MILPRDEVIFRAAEMISGRWNAGTDKGRANCENLKWRFHNWEQGFGLIVL